MFIKKRPKPKKISIDIETYSATDIKKHGLFRYTMDSAFEIMLLAYKIDNEIPICIDLTAGEQIPFWLRQYIDDPDVIKTAWNANFEIGCLSREFGYALDASQWRCTMARAAYNGYPLSLDAAGKALRLPKEKLSAGKDLIRYFCIPCKGTKRNEGRLRNRSTDDPEKWQLFKEYCIRDVEVEAEIDSRLLFKLPATEQKIYTLDQKINKRGFNVDLTLINKVMQLDTDYRAHLRERAIEITGVDNPNSTQQLLKWLNEEMEDYVTHLDKKNVEALKKIAPNEQVAELLDIRKELALSTVKKYGSMLAYADESGCVRGTTQYYGANRTGRFAGRGVQPQNFASNKLKYSDLLYLRNLVREGTSYSVLGMLYDSVSGCLKELVRTAIVPGYGQKLLAGDFSAIEAVVLAWLSNEPWRVKAFEAKKDIYIASIARMMNIPESGIDKNIPEGKALRQRGKVSELALGYGGAAGALIQMGALDMGIKEIELDGIVARWRLANPQVCKSWQTVQSAFKHALLHPGEIVGCLRGILKFQFYRGKMLMRLPSGRFLVYDTPELIDGKLSYYGQDQKTRQWARIPTYGGKLIENATQAIARDLLTEAMLRVDAAGFRIVLHVHDEIVVEVDANDEEAAERLEKLMSIRPEWGKDILIRAECFEGSFYRKG